MCTLYTLFDELCDWRESKILDNFGVPCFANDSYNIFPNNASSISPAYLLGIHNVFLYISIWEFICCQSPQHMKGLLFALFYAVSNFNRVLAVLFLILFLYLPKTQLVGCPFIFYAVNLIVGLIL